MQRAFFGGVNAATARVLAAEGFEVHAPAEPRCCGALQMHAGDDEPARELARRTIAALERFDAVVMNAAGCGSPSRASIRSPRPWTNRHATRFASSRISIQRAGRAQQVAAPAPDQHLGGGWVAEEGETAGAVAVRAAVEDADQIAQKIYNSDADTVI